MAQPGGRKACRPVRFGQFGNRQLVGLRRGGGVSERDFAKTQSDLLLSKPIGLPAHAGGKPFVDANSTQYKALAALVPEMAAQSCVTTVVTPPPVAGGTPAPAPARRRRPVRR